MLARVLAATIGCATLLSCAGLLDLSQYEHDAEGGGGADTTSAQGGDGGGAAGMGGAGADARCFVATDGCACPLPNTPCEATLGGQWTGPVSLYEGYEVYAPDCASTLTRGATARSAVKCPSCSCDTPAVSCTTVTTVHTDPICGDTGGGITLSQVSSCQGLPNVGNGIRIANSFTESGSCQPSGVAGIHDEGFVSTCALQDGSCEARCHALPPEGYARDICFMHPGDVPCPDAFPLRHPIFDPEAGCTTCECEAATGVDCDLELYDDTVCSKRLQTIFTSNSCQMFDISAEGAQLVTADPGWCPPSGGEPIAMQAPAFTVCCAAGPR